MHVLKRWIGPILAAAILLVLPSTNVGLAQAASRESRIRLVIIKTRDIPFYAPSVKGLLDGLKSKGFGAREKIDIKIFALTGRVDTDTSLVEAQVSAKPDLIVTLGTDATRLTADRKPVTPVLFAMVLDPVSLGVVQSLDSPGGMFSGVTIPVSPGKQIEAILQAAPRVRSIGLLYTDRDPTSLAFLAEAREDAKRLSVDLSVVPVTPSESTHSALLRFPKLPDAIWLLPDPASSGPLAAKETLDYANAHRLAVLGTSSGSVRSGALLALSADLEDQGSAVAEMAARVLDGTETPAHMRVRGPRRTTLALNLATARRLHIDIPKVVLHLADEVIEADQEDK